MKSTWIKPTIKTKELKLRTLLGENGWLNNNPSSKDLLAATVTAR